MGSSRSSFSKESVKVMRDIVLASALDQLVIDLTTNPETSS